MIDVFKVAAECLHRFHHRQGGLKSLALGQKVSPGAVYALCMKVMDNREVLTRFVDGIAGTCTRNDEVYWLLVVLVFEVHFHGYPNKRRRASKDTRNAVASLKRLASTEAIQELPLAGEERQGVAANVWFRMSRGKEAEVAKKLGEVGVEFQPTAFPSVIKLGSRPPHGTLTGLGEFQSLSSCLPVFCLEELWGRTQRKQNPTLLDLCAAPGSKSIQAAESFRVTANELDPRRYGVLERRCSPYGVKTVNLDAFKLLDLVKPGGYDVFLLDPSCSSSGTAQEDRRLSGEAGQSVAQLAAFQLRLLTKALQVGLASGVTYVSYSTCSIYDEENEQVVEKALQTAPEWKLSAVLPGWKTRGIRHPEVVRAGEANNDGFFVAVFERV